MPEDAGASLHPEIWVFRQLLAAAGLPADPATALGLAGGAGFLGVGFRYERADRSTLHLSGWNPFQSDLPGAAQRLGLVGTLDETTRRRRAAKSLAAGLATGEPLALWLDTATVGLAPAALTEASPGVVLARPAGDLVELADGTATVTVDPSILARARGVHVAQRHRLLALRSAHGLEAAPAMRAGLARTAVGPTGGEPEHGGPDGARALGEAVGAGADDPRSWRTVFAGDRHLLGALTNLHAAITRERGLLRGPQAAFERAAAIALELPGLDEVAALHEELAEGWLAVAGRALPADVPGLAAARGARSALELPAELTAAPLPLSRGEQEELLADLARAVLALAPIEDEALERLRSTLRPG